MGNSVSSIKNINFEDMLSFIERTSINANSINANSINENTIIINTLAQTNQGCLIKGTISIHDEIKILNLQLNKEKNTNIVIYGLNACDNTIIKKYEQLLGLGFYNVFVYPGGLFEWLLLQDIYGFKAFPTTTKENDLLKYKGHRIFNVKMIEHYS
jgi:hypothetical protein